MKALSLLFVLLTCTTRPLAQNNATQQLEALLQSYASAGRFSGSVLVAKNDTVLLQKGYGYQRLTDSSLNKEQTAFQIASVTKTFTATLLLQLVKQQKIALNDKLSSYYKGFSNGNSITIEHLLTHTSGLHNFTESDTIISETDETRMVPYLASLPADFTPGSKWHYSNSGYVMLGFIIQKVCGLSYWQAVRRYLFEPLHMRGSGFDFTHLNAIHKATGYESGTSSEQKAAVITDSTPPFAAGAIYSTVADLYKWHKGLQHYQVIDSTLATLAYTPGTYSNYGYGWQIDSVYGDKMVSHSGAIAGFSSNLARIPARDLCIILLSNQAGATGELITITRKITAILYGEPYRMLQKRTPVTLPAPLLNTYTGTYEIPALHLVITLYVATNQLMVQPVRDGNPGPSSRLLATTNLHFYDQRDDEVTLLFDRDSTGYVKGFTLQLLGQTHYAQKIK